MENKILPIDTIYQLNDSLHLLHNIEQNLSIHLPSYGFYSNNISEIKIIYSILVILFIAIFRYNKSFNPKELFKNIFGLQKPKFEIPIIPTLISILLGSVNTTIILSNIIDTNLYLNSKLILAGIFITYIFLMFLLCSLFGWTFNNTHSSKSIFINIVYFFQNTSIITSPLVVLYFYLPHSEGSKIMFLCYGILIICKIIKLLQSFNILYKNRVSILYLILYLCALEFIPLFVLYKLSINYFV